MVDLNIVGGIIYIRDSVSNCFFSVLDSVAKIIDDCVRPFFRSFWETDGTVPLGSNTFVVPNDVSQPRPTPNIIKLSDLDSLIPQGGRLMSLTPSRTSKQKETPTNPVLSNLDVAPDTFSSDDENSDSEEENKDTRSAFGFMPTINWGSLLRNDEDEIKLKEEKQNFLNAILMRSVSLKNLEPEDNQGIQEEIKENIFKLSSKDINHFKENGGTPQDVVDFIDGDNAFSYSDFKAILEEIIKLKKDNSLSDFPNE